MTACGVAITADNALAPVARRLAKELHLPFAGADDDDRFDAMLALVPDRLELRWLGQQRFRPTRVELTAIDGLSPQGRSLRQPIARAVGLAKGDPYRPTVLDATAGFGEDAWLLASLGCRVTAVERCPVMAALLADGLRHAAAIHPDIGARLTLHYADSITLLKQIEPHDVVYLDPMFPPRKKSAKERKQMWMLRQMVGDDADNEALFIAARRVARLRVVIKRPLHAPPLTDDPVATHKGRTHRYDVYPASTSG